MDTLRRIAAYLVEHERVDGETFDELFDGRRPVPNAGDEWRAATSRPRAWGDVVDLAAHRVRTVPVIAAAVAAPIRGTGSSGRARSTPPHRVSRHGSPPPPSRRRVSPRSRQILADDASPRRAPATGRPSARPPPDRRSAPPPRCRRRPRPRPGVASGDRGGGRPALGAAPPGRSGTDVAVIRRTTSGLRPQDGDAPEEGRRLWSEQVNSALSRGADGARDDLDLQFARQAVRCRCRPGRRADPRRAGIGRPRRPRPAHRLSMRGSARVRRNAP